VTGLSDSHIVYASFTNHIAEAVPYVVSVDHKRRAVVITCRGTLSLGDLVTDLLCEPTELDIAGRQFGFDGRGHYAHSGMLDIALKIRVDIERQGILRRLMDERGPDPQSPASPSQLQRQASARAAQHRPSLVMADDKGEMFASEVFADDAELAPLSSGYRLVTVGHSMGGSIAAILALLLRERYPHVRCVAYSPAGPTFSKEMAEKTAEFVLSVVPGKDMVPRLSWHSMLALRGKILDVIRRSKRDKLRTMLTFARGSPDRALDDFLYAEDEVPNTPERQRLAECLHKISVPSDSVLDRVRMYVPGRVMQLAKQYTRVGALGRVTRVYAPFWVRDREELQDTIPISHLMLTDHFPDLVDGVVRAVLADLREELKEAEGARGGAVVVAAPAPLRV